MVVERIKWSPSPRGLQNIDRFVKDAESLGWSLTKRTDRLLYFARGTKTLKFGLYGCAQGTTSLKRFERMNARMMLAQEA